VVLLVHVYFGGVLLVHGLLRLRKCILVELLLGLQNLVSLSIIQHFVVVLSAFEFELLVLLLSQKLQLLFVSLLGVILLGHQEVVLLPGVFKTLR
jgi:hypothetical protein